MMSLTDLTLARLRLIIPGWRIRNSRGNGFFSNPSRPNIGVDVYWQRSDKKQWHVKCSHCGEWQPLDYWENVCQERKCYICRKCKGIIDDDARLNGEWVAEYPGRDWSGYHISQLIAPWITAAEIIEQEQTKSQEYFYNFVLGLPVIGGSQLCQPSYYPTELPGTEEKGQVQYPWCGHRKSSPLRPGE